MNNPPLKAPDQPIPLEGFLVTHMLVVADPTRSRDFYVRVFDATVVKQAEPAILRIANSWLILITGGGPTDDKPDVVAVRPQDGRVFSSAMNLRVANIQECYERWRERGAEFITEVKDHVYELRCYIRDPDGHLIEVGQSKS